MGIEPTYTGTTNRGLNRLATTATYLVLTLQHYYLYLKQITNASIFSTRKNRNCQILTYQIKKSS